MTVRTIAVAVVAALVAGGPPLPAQDNPSLQEAARLAAEGRGEAARRVVAAELARARPGEPAYIEALFWRARLTAFGDSAERDLRRIAIEYPTSRWADDALLLLAQLALAAGNPTSAFALAERLRSDYPDSDLRPGAAFWAGRAAFDLDDQRAACALLDSAREEAATDVEFVNRVGFYRGRCGALPADRPAPQALPPSPAAVPPADSGPAPQAAAPRSDTSRAPQGPQAGYPARQGPEGRQSPTSPAAAAAPAPGERPRGWVVQVAAVQTDAEEQRVLERLRGAGYQGYVVPGTGRFRRVRVAGFAGEAAARRAVPALRRIVGGQPFAVRER